MSATKQVEMDKMAMAIQHTIHLMRGEKPTTLALDLGIQISNNILLPFAAELALKGLRQQETTPDGFIKTHDLAKLFRDVSLGAQSRSDKRFRQYMSQDDETKYKNVDLWLFFEKHRNDFVEWRYLEDTEEGSLVPVYKEFQYAICSILDEVYEGQESLKTV